MATDSFELARHFSADHPQEAARVMAHLPKAAGTTFMRELPRSVTTKILSAMLPAEATAHLAGMPTAEALQLIHEMPPHRAANIIRLLPPDLRDTAMDGQNPVRRSQIQFYLRQERGIVGAWVETNVVVAHHDEPVESIQRKCSAYDGNIPLVFTVDAGQKFLGTISPVSMLSAASTTPASQLLKPMDTVLRAHTPIEVAVADAAWRDNDILAVAGTDGGFLGVIRYTVLRHTVDDLASEISMDPLESGLDSLADAWILGLSDVLGASMARPASRARGADLEREKSS